MPAGRGETIDNTSIWGAIAQEATADETAIVKTREQRRMMANLLTIVSAVVAALGGLIYGVDSGIIATTIGHDTFKLYMFGPSMTNTALIGALVSVYNAGQSVGSASVGYLADRFSRKYTISFAASLATIGAVLQTAAQNIGMMIAGRLIAGISCGMILSAVPVYLAETSHPDTRGFMVGLQGMMIAIGFALANWIGYGGAFASGDAQWRIPLGMQVPAAVVLTIGAIFIPFSPRWLIQQDRHEHARQVLVQLFGAANTDLVDQQMHQIQEQIAFEKRQEDPSWSNGMKKLFSRRYIRRTMTATFIIAMGQLSGSSVIQNFQNIFYAAVGFTGRTSLLISGVYGMMGVIGQIIYLVIVADKWPRARTLWSGSVVLSVMISIVMAFSATFGSGNDTSGGAGPRAAIAFIFIYSMCYAIFFNAMIFVVPSELFPFFLRTKGLSVAVSVKAIVAIVLSQITPIAIEQVSWRYYALFIATNMSAALIYFLWLPETGHKSLEEIAELFGDTLATERMGEIDMDKQRAVSLGSVVGIGEEVDKDGTRAMHREA